MDSLDLDQDLAEDIDLLVRSRGSASRTEVVRDAIHRLITEERERQLTHLDEAIRRGLADADAGRVTPAEEVFDRLERKYKAMIDDEAK